MDRRNNTGSKDIEGSGRRKRSILASLISIGQFVLY